MRRNHEYMETTIVKISQIAPNEGQVEGLPNNPRLIKNREFELLKKSMEESPEMLHLRELIVYPHGKKYVVIGGNMRLRAAKALGFKELPCKILPEDTPIEKLREYCIKDNNGFGEYDFDILANEWGDEPLSDWGVKFGNFFDDEESEEQEKTAPKGKADQEQDYDEEIDDDKEAFYRQMFKDVLYESNNPFEIPNLLLERQAGKLELPLSPWGANSRLRKDVATYHFYVDDYRFEALFKDPINLLTSGCRAIVEPNCSLHDQTPIAWGLQLIYKKRWLSRYLQECGIDVYADLNVSHKFIEYNKMGIPKGYNAFATRGLTGWVESLKSDLIVAQEISGLERPNLIVYGGGADIREFCQEHSLLYVTDFINAKKE